MTVTTNRRARLSARTLGTVRGAALPSYDRNPATSLTHVGLGAFARAHVGTYMDDLLSEGRAAAAWRGVSLHSRRAEEQLRPQDCYYSVAERESGSDPALRVIGSLAAVTTGPASALEALTVPTTELVTVTITEKGYDPHASAADPGATAPGLLALALARWRDGGSTPPVILSLDNVADNGGLLRARVTEIAHAFDPGLAEWVDATVRFPNSVVDRMVPATTPGDLEAISNQLGLIDLAAVMTERHRSWIVAEDERLAPFERVGVQLVEDVLPFEQRKLWLLNGPHSAFAYCGLLFGCATIADAAAHDTVAGFVAGLVDDLIAGAELPAALAPASFAADVLRRFRNPYLGHTCAQVAADGSRKLPQRFGAVVGARRRRALDNTRAALVVAAWIAVVAGLDVPGTTLPAIDDPDRTLLVAAAGRDLEHVARVALLDRFDDAFASDVGRALERLVREGPDCLRAAA